MAASGSGAGLPPALNEVQARLRGGDLSGATRVALAALAAGERNPLFLHLRAHLLESQNRPGEALADLDLAVRIAPRDPVAHFARGQLLLRLRQSEAAAEALTAATALKPDYLAAHLERAEACSQSGDSAACRAALEAAIALAPEHADALAQLSEILARAGRFEQADAYAARALKAQSGHHVALIAQAICAMGERRLDDAARLLRKLERRKDLPPPAAASREHLQGELEHARKKYGRAFEAYGRGNAIKRKLYAPDYARPGAKTARDFAHWLAQPLEAERSAPPPAPLAPAPGDPAAHVFALGFPRSGTTLLHNVLMSHPRVTGVQERALIKEAAAAFLSDEAGRRRLAAADESVLAPYRRSYWRKAAEAGAGEVAGKLFLDTRPLGAGGLRAIERLFPSATVLLVVRDPRDVVLSCFRSNFTMGGPIYELLTLEGAARFYDAMMGLALAHCEAGRMDWRTHRHEDFIADFEARSRALCAGLGLEWSDAVLDFAARAEEREIGTVSAAQVRRGVNREGVGQWRRYAEQMTPVLPILAPWVARFGYPPD